ncbi:hypothetical protein EOM09_05025 [bacterium]|nr:hypothetical protein [bacterium]
MKWWFKTIMLLVAIGILYISFVMASLSRVLEDEKSNKLRKIQIAYINNKGERLCYKLPESKVLPNSIFYPIKSLRDSLWISFSRDKTDKLRILLLVRDKKIEEFLLLSKNEFNEKVISKQMSKIEGISDELNVNFEEVGNIRMENSEIRQRIEISNEFYKFFTEKFNNGEELRNCYE